VPSGCERSATTKLVDFTGHLYLESSTPMMHFLFMLSPYPLYHTHWLALLSAVWLAQTTIELNHCHSHSLDRLFSPRTVPDARVSRAQPRAAPGTKLSRDSFRHRRCDHRCHTAAAVATFRIVLQQTSFPLPKNGSLHPRTRAHTHSTPLGASFGVSLIPIGNVLTLLGVVGYRLSP
jgi:hypothetical protein